MYAARESLLDGLDEAYFTLLDCFAFKDAVMELLTSMMSKKVKLNLKVNTQLTALFLELLASFTALMILVSRIDDRRVICALYSMAHEQLRGSGYTTDKLTRKK